MSSFAEMKEKRKSAIANLVAAAETTSEKQSYGDDRIWKPTVDKAGNGYAIIRFLPAPMVKIYLGCVIGITGSRDQVVNGISKIH